MRNAQKIVFNVIIIKLVKYVNKDQNFQKNKINVYLKSVKPDFL